MRKIPKGRLIYGKSHYDLQTSDLIAIAHSKISARFVKDFLKKFDGKETDKIDAFILALGQILESFAFTQSRLPGISLEIAKLQQAKLREAAQEILQSFT